jgi:hypothetical protein
MIELLSRLQTKQFLTFSRPLNQPASVLNDYNILQEVPHFDGKTEGSA